jgi:hypothetical protein
VKNGECGQFEKALDRGEDAVAALEVHAASCADCRERLRLWKEIPQAAPSLKKEWESPDLFPRIARSLAAAVPPPGSPAPSLLRRRWPAWIPAAAAAALFVLSMIGLSVFKPGESGREPLSNLRASREPLMTEQTFNEVESAEAKYLESIEKLSRLARPRLENPETSLLAAYKEKLELLDSAIAETRNQIDQNRFNTHLRRELLAMYQEKQRTLQDLMKEAKS